MSFIAKETQGFYRMKLIKSLIFSSKNQLFYSSSYCTYLPGGTKYCHVWLNEHTIYILIYQSRTSPEAIYLYVISFRHNYLLRHYWTDKTVACEKQNFQEILAIKNVHFIITFKCMKLVITNQNLSIKFFRPSYIANENNMFSMEFDGNMINSFFCPKSLIIYMMLYIYNARSYLLSLS